MKIYFYFYDKILIEINVSASFDDFPLIYVILYELRKHEKDSTILVFI